MPAAAPLVVETTLPVPEVRARLAASLAASLAARGAPGAELPPFRGRVEGDTVFLRLVHARARRGRPPLSARLEARPGGGTRLVGTVAPDFMMLLPAFLAFVPFVVGVEGRVPLLALLGLAGGFVGWRAFRRSARVEADAFRSALASLLRA